MSRKAGVWFRKQVGRWYTTLHGKQIDLGVDRQQAELEFHRLHSLSEPLEARRQAVIALVGNYLDWAKQRLAEATWKRYRIALQAWVESYGRLKADELRPFHVTRWREKHLDEWNDSTAGLSISIVKIWSAWCVAEGYLEVDRLRAIRTPGIAKRAPAPVGDFERILAQTSTIEFRDFLEVLWGTGCRPGEIRSLEAARIDWATSTAEVIGKRGKRRVGLARTVVEILRRNAELHPVGAVLRNSRGDPWSVTAVRAALIKACKRAGVAHFVPYHARHGYWQRAMRAGVDSVLVAKQLGHTNLKMLLERYAHPDRDQLSAVAEQTALGSAPHAHEGQSAHPRDQLTPTVRAKRKPSRE